MLILTYSLFNQHRSKREERKRRRKRKNRKKTVQNCLHITDSVFYQNGKFKLRFAKSASQMKAVVIELHAKTKENEISIEEIIGFAQTKKSRKSETSIFN